MLVRLAITIEMPIELPTLRTSVSIDGAVGAQLRGASVRNATVVSGTNTKPDAERPG